MRKQFDILAEQLDIHVGREARENILQGYDEITGATKLKSAKWWKVAMERMDALVDEPTRAGIMEKCGWCCAWGNRAEKIKAFRKKTKTIEEFYERLQKLLNPGVGTERDGYTIYTSYPKCYCTRVSATKEAISLTHCHCSRGYWVAMFTTALGRPVNVDLLQSIINGADKCRFAIHIPEDEF